ncbi:hypothetical protein U1Q18_011490 [Sarracenia purpurea var. burkii]
MLVFIMFIFYINVHIDPIDEPLDIHNVKFCSWCSIFTFEAEEVHTIQPKEIKYIIGYSLVDILEIKVPPKLMLPVSQARLVVGVGFTDMERWTDLGVVVRLLEDLAAAAAGAIDPNDDHRFQISGIFAKASRPRGFPTSYQSKRGHCVSFFVFWVPAGLLGISQAIVIFGALPNRS